MNWWNKLEFQSNGSIREWSIMLNSMMCSVYFVDSQTFRAQSQKHYLEPCYYVCILNNLSFTSKAQGLGVLFFLVRLTLTCISIKRRFNLPTSSPWNIAYSLFFCFVLLKAKAETVNAWSVNSQHWWVGTWGITSTTQPVSNPDYTGKL